MQCQQSVVIESCCDPVQCPDEATMHHPATGATLCAVHYANGEKYALSGEWPVGKRTIPFPDGWEPAPTDEAAASSLVLDGEQTASGLYIERDPAPAEAAPPVLEIVRAGGEDRL